MPRRRKDEDEDEAIESDDDSSSSSGSSSSSDEAADEGEFGVEFVAVPPSNTDRNGIAMLLRQQFRHSPVDIFDLTDIVIDQGTDGIGHIMISALDDDESNNDDDDAEDDIFALSTILPIAKYSKKKPIQQLLSWLSTNCPSVVSKDDTFGFGLLINERMANLPEELAARSFASLKEDLANSRDLAVKGIKKLILISRTIKTSGGQTKKGGQPTKKKSKQQDTSQQENFEFVHTEDAVLAKRALRSDRFVATSKGTEDAGSSEVIAYQVMLLPIDCLDQEFN